MSRMHSLSTHPSLNTSLPKYPPSSTSSSSSSSTRGPTQSCQHVRAAESYYSDDTSSIIIPVANANNKSFFCLCCFTAYHVSPIQSISRYGWFVLGILYIVTALSSFLWIYSQDWTVDEVFIGQHYPNDCRSLDEISGSITWMRSFRDSSDGRTWTNASHLQLYKPVRYDGPQSFNTQLRHLVLDHTTLLRYFHCDKFYIRDMITEFKIGFVISRFMGDRIAFPPHVNGNYSYYVDGDGSIVQCFLQWTRNIESLIHSDLLVDFLYDRQPKTCVQTVDTFSYFITAMSTLSLAAIVSQIARFLMRRMEVLNGGNCLNRLCTPGSSPSPCARAHAQQHNKMQMFGYYHDGPGPPTGSSHGSGHGNGHGDDDHYHYRPL
jgi:hypothetical protein